MIVHVRELPRQQPRQLAAHLRAIDRAAHRIVCNSAATARRHHGVRRSAIVFGSSSTGWPSPFASGLRPTTPTRFTSSVQDESVLTRVKPCSSMLLHRRRRRALTGTSTSDLRFRAPRVRRRTPGSRRRARARWSRTWHGDTAVPDALYDNAHVAVVSSMSTGEFSLGIAEAQIRGLPVVVVGPGEPCEKPDRADETVVLSGDVAGLRAALEHLDHHRELLGEWGETVRRTSCAQFGLDRYRREIVDEIDAGAIERPGMLVLTPSADLYGSRPRLFCMGYQRSSSRCGWSCCLRWMARSSTRLGRWKRRYWLVPTSLFADTNAAPSAISRLLDVPCRRCGTCAVPHQAPPALHRVREHGRRCSATADADLAPSGGAACPRTGSRELVRKVRHRPTPPLR